jgi:Icc-related predicted phosphoesterase
MKDRGREIKAIWDKIPLDTDILITHGPPSGILDFVDPKNSPGCEDLTLKLKELKKLKLHVFGHIHESYGTTVRDGVQFVNASIMNGDYEPVHSPIRIVL